MIHPTYAQYSRIRYLVDPARPDLFPVPLGVAVEVVVGKQWLVGISVRSALSEEEIGLLDGIARDLLRNPFELMKSDVSALTVNSQKPGDILHALASTKIWSMNVTSPQPWSLSLKRGSIQPQVKEEMSVLWKKVVAELLRGAAKEEHAPKPKKHARVAQGRLFVQDDCWRAPLAAN
jgi:hypothetical protein